MGSMREGDNVSLAGWRQQLTLISWLAFATGCVVGVAKFGQVLMTSAKGQFETHSEGRAEMFLLTFGISKAIGNLVIGGAADTAGRRPCMTLGWVLGAVFCVASILAPTWDVVVAADLLLGLNQAFCWSVAIFMAIDWSGPTRRAQAVGLVETFGYSAIALASPLVGGVGVDGVRMLHGLLLVICLGCAFMSRFLLRETRVIASKDATVHPAAGTPSTAAGDGMGEGQFGAVVWRSGRRDDYSTVRLVWAHVSCLDGALMACCLVGLALNFASAFAWGAMTRWLSGLDVDNHSAAGLVLLAYSMPKGLLQLPAGAMADRRFCSCGPREFVLLGLAAISASLLCMALLTAVQLEAQLTILLALPLALILGCGTAVAYSPVVACVVCRAEPSWRSAAIGTYRFWRDLGYAVGGLLLGNAVDSAKGVPWVAPLLASMFVVVTIVVFARVYPGQQPVAPSTSTSGVRRSDEMSPAEQSGNPGVLLAHSMPRSEMA